jgi:diguanylate cyclase (GGDEF)-like protein
MELGVVPVAGEVAPAGHGLIVDVLTGAVGRAGLVGCVDEAVVEADRAGVGCCLFLFDVDHFKSVNDAYGHARGDVVLRQLAERVGQLVRGSDVLVRYGGDEFVVVLPLTSRVEAMEVAVRLVEGVKGVPFAGSPPLSVSVSVGVASFPDDAVGCEGLLEVADRRSYLAKGRGRGCAVGEDLVFGTGAASGRLLERDAALAVAQDFLVRLAVGGRGVLRVNGEPGAGHSRFLAEVSNLARLRGFSVHCITGAGIGVDGSVRPEDRVLIVADTDVAAGVADDLVRELSEGERAPVVLGMLSAVQDLTMQAGQADHVWGEQRSVAPALPLLGSVALSPLSEESLRVWLRTTLLGEPSSGLVSWLARRGRGLPARVERELARLGDGGNLERGDGGDWGLSSAMLERVSGARRRLPAAMSTLIGREENIIQVAGLVIKARLVTLVGAGGMGKTRLSLAVASTVADEFEEGAVFVPLADATTTALVASSVAQVLEVAEVPGEPLTDTIRGHLAERELLLVLDNFEQVLGAGPFVAELLASAPRVRVLVTSQERLRLPGEQVYLVPPLPLPDLARLPGRSQDIAAAVATSPALGLFVARAREAAYDLVLSPADVRAVAELCHRLDGLPLAIELAAARCDTLTPAELLGELVRRFDLLADGPLDLPRRQQTLRATIDWSFALLDAVGQDLMRTLAVFTSGATVDAVSDVWLPVDVTLADSLSVLVDKNLLRVLSTGGGIRYTMLETIRAYTGERLAASADADEVHARFAEYFAGFAERADRELVGPGQAEWSGLVNDEYLNLRAAYEWAMSQGQESMAGRITLGLSRYWDSGRHISEGRQWHDRVLTRPVWLPDRLRAELLASAAFLASVQDDLAATLQLGDEGLSLARGLGDHKILAQALNVVAIAARMFGDYDRARELHSEGLALCQEHDDKPGVASASSNLAMLAVNVGDLDTAHELGVRTLDLQRELGNTLELTLTMLNLCEVHLRRGDADRARPLVAESLELSLQLGDVFCEAAAIYQLGLMARLDGNHAEAFRQLAAALVLSHRVGWPAADVAALVDLADLLSVAHPRLAARILGVAEAAREHHQLTFHEYDLTRWRETTGLVRSALTETELSAAWAYGRTIPLEDLVEELSGLDPRSVTAAENV